MWNDVFVYADKINHVILKCNLVHFKMEISVKNILNDVPQFLLGQLSRVLRSIERKKANKAKQNTEYNFLISKSVSVSRFDLSQTVTIYLKSIKRLKCCVLRWNFHPRFFASLLWMCDNGDSEDEDGGSGRDSRAIETWHKNSHFKISNTRTR